MEIAEKLAESLRACHEHIRNTQGFAGGEFIAQEAEEILQEYEESLPKQEFRVTWEIDVSARNHFDAAIEAQKAMRDPDTSATVFEVRGTANGLGYPQTVDLVEYNETHPVRKVPHITTDELLNMLDGALVREDGRISFPYTENTDVEDEVNRAVRLINKHFLGEP